VNYILFLRVRFLSARTNFLFFVNLFLVYRFLNNANFLFILFYLYLLLLKRNSVLGAGSSKVFCVRV